MHPLAYLELRYAAHQAAAILRSPARLALWLPYVASLAILAYLRTLGRRPNSHAGFTLDAAHATALGSIYLALLFAAIALAAGGRVTAFRTSAEAIFFSNAGVRPLTIVVWLQLRKFAAGWTRLFGGALYVFLLFAPPSPAGTLRALVATLLALALQNMVELPAFLVSRGRPNVAIRTAAWSAAGYTLVLAAIGFFADRYLGPVLALTRFNPGPAARAILSGSWTAVGALALLLALLVGSIAVLGRNALPDIYGASLRTLVRQRHSRTSPVNFALSRGGKAARIPAGALTLVWKDWVGFRRGRGALRLWLFACGFWALCGAGVAYVATHGDDAAPLISLGGLTVVMVFSLAPLGSAAGLASDLAKPIFWLSPTPLRARIAAWTFARTWRGAIAIGLGPCAAGIVSGKWTLAAVALPLMFAVYWSLQALGVGLYALFPNPIDARGPLSLLRSVVTLGFAVPPLAFAALALAVHAHVLGAALSAAVTFALEGTLAVAFASHRFHERGATLAMLTLSG